MQKIQHQMFVTGRLHCGFEVFLVKESVTIRIMKDFKYENDVVLKLFYFYDEVIFLSILQKMLKLKEPVKSYWKML